MEVFYVVRYFKHQLKYVRLHFYNAPSCHCSLHSGSWTVPRPAPSMNEKQNLTKPAKYEENLRRKNRLWNQHTFCCYSSNVSWTKINEEAGDQQNFWRNLKEGRGSHCWIFSYTFRSLVMKALFMEASIWNWKEELEFWNVEFFSLSKSSKITKSMVGSKNTKFRGVTCLKQPPNFIIQVRILVPLVLYPF